MSEIINTYLMNDPERLVPMKRSEFYKEQIEIFKETGIATRACDIVDIFIFNSDGDVLIQKRSKNKNHNPGLFDKSIGGHVRAGDSYMHTVMLETIQELQTPSIVLENKRDFEKTLNTLAKYTETVAIVKHHDSEIHKLSKMLQGEKIDILNKVNLYFGIYDGRTRPVDKEALGVLYYKFDDLLEEMKINPDIYTQDLHSLISIYETDIREFIERIKKIKKD